MKSTLKLSDIVYSALETSKNHQGKAVLIIQDMNVSVGIKILITIYYRIYYNSTSEYENDTKAENVASVQLATWFLNTKKWMKTFAMFFLVYKNTLVELRAIFINL